MSYRHVNYVRDNSKTMGMARLLLLTIATRTDDEGYAYPSYGRLAKDTGMKIRSIRRLIEREIPKDEMEVIQGGSRKGQKRLATLYRVIIKGDDCAPDAHSDSNDCAPNAHSPDGHDCAHTGTDCAHIDHDCAHTGTTTVRLTRTQSSLESEEEQETTTTRAREPSEVNGAATPKPNVVVVPSVLNRKEGTEKEGLVSALTKDHVTVSVAEELASAFPERIELQIEVMESLGNEVKDRGQMVG